MTACIRTSVFILAFALASQTLAAQRAARIDSINPAAARVGDIVTISGNGFGALNVRVTVGGMNAGVLTANGNQVTFRVPDNVRAGLTQVAAVNPGGQTGTIPFRVLDGILLSGNPNALVLDTVFDLAPVGADENDIRDGVIVTRLDLFLAPRATVGNLNAALRAVNGGIVTMLRRQPVVTIAIPPPADFTALLLVVKRLNAMTGVSHASIGRSSGPKVLPPSPAGDDYAQLQHLLPARFPAAWNAKRLATSDCSGRKVNVLVGDYFAQSNATNFADEVPGATFTGQFAPSTGHGYEVAATLAARFNGSSPTGANPFPECLNVKLVGLTSMTWYQEVARLTRNFPDGKFLLNYSAGYTDLLPCMPSCTDDDVHRLVDTPLLRAYHGAEWRQATIDREDDFLAGVAAGNERNKPGTRVYGGLGVAAFDSYMSVATLPDLVTFQLDAAQWNPFGEALPDLVTGPEDLAVFQQRLQDFGLADTGPAANVLLAGSGTAGVIAGQVSESSFSDSGADLFAVGEEVFTLGQFTQGTSFSAPQITGLASYLWLLSGGAHAKTAAVADLSTMAPSVTRQAILRNAQDGSGIKVIDAYAAALSIDAAALPTPSTAPVRLALLDLDDNDLFDEGDVAAFITTYIDTTGQLVEPTLADYGRRDLNGDGYTGGSITSRFDLDRVGSVQFGAPQYSTVLQNIGGDVSFNENALTDLQILCYYAYSDLFTGHKDTRDDLLVGRCAAITVQVAPAAVTLQPGATQQFAATVKGTPNANVTWTATGGTITSTGLFTAGSNGGVFKVRAISVVDPNAFGDATVNVTSGGVSVPLAQSKTDFGGSFMLCLPGPTNAPNSDKSPFGLDRSLPPPNGGPLATGSLLSAPVTQSANCQQVVGGKNVAEVSQTLTATSGSATWDLYASSDKTANMEALALVHVKMPVAGVATITMSSEWIKGLSTTTGTGTAGVGVFSTIHNDSLFCQFLRGPTQSTPLTSCTGPTTLTLTLNAGDVIVLSGSIVRAGEGSGRLFTLTFTPSP